ncbi:MAG TPA: hypothetical protein VK177_07570 [Flavobacteriales bacterium]|nr:hypothetical protein [Flavobacteriales bacterium]
MKLIVILSAFLIGITNDSYAFKGDLTQLVKRPGKNELYVCGEFKTVFVLDAKTGETIRTFSVDEAGITSLQFTPDGSILLAANYNTVHLLDPNTGSKLKSIKGANFILSQAGKYIINMDRWGKKVQLLNSSDGTIINTIACDFEPVYASLSPESDKLYIMGNAQEIKNEKSLLTQEVKAVAGYNTYNKAFMDQQADKKGAAFLEVDVNSFKAKPVVMIPYTPGMSTFGKLISAYNTNIYIMSFEMFIKVDKSGKAYPMETDLSNFAYAAENTSTGRYIVNASGLKGFIYDCETNKYASYNAADFMSSVYAMDICTSNDTIYLLGSDYTILTMDTKGNVYKKFRLSNPGEGIKFGTYYTNGYTTKELRDKEALIVNTLLKEKSLPEIDLETSLSNGDKEPLIGAFSTYEEASDFVKELKERKLNYVVKIYPVSVK